MKILLIDDYPKHLVTGKLQFVGHEITALEEYTPAFDLLKSGCGFDVVLTDYLMPAEARTLGSRGLAYLGHPMAIGVIIALRAAEVGVPRVVCITDAGHHDHPMSAALDYFKMHRIKDLEVAPVLRVENSNLLIAHAPLLADGSKDWKTALEACPAPIRELGMAIDCMM
jgi:CheY-like chemotaxis protein